jgi:hypothetical protein
MWQMCSRNQLLYVKTYKQLQQCSFHLPTTCDLRICIQHTCLQAQRNSPHECHPITHKIVKCHPSTIKVAARQLVRCHQLPIHRLPKEVANIANTLDTKSQFPPIMHHNGSQLPHCVHGHHLSQCMWLASITTCKSICKEACHPHTCTCDTLDPSPHIKGLTTIYPRHVASLAKPSSAKISKSTTAKATYLGRGRLPATSAHY